jgi:hypothetical protein
MMGMRCGLVIKAVFEAIACMWMGVVVGDDGGVGLVRSLPVSK